MLVVPQRNGLETDIVVDEFILPGAEAFLDAIEARKHQGFRNAARRLIGVVWHASP